MLSDYCNIFLAYFILFLLCVSIILFHFYALLYVFIDFS